MTLLNEMASGIGQILTAVFNNPSVLWVILPLLSIWFLLEIYFGMYKRAKLGWNSAIGNGMTIFWIGVTLMGFVFNTKPIMFEKVGVLVLFIIYGLFLTYISFTRKLSNHITFILASPSAVYYPAIFIALWAYNTLMINLGLLIDILILYPVVVGIFWIIKRRERPVDLAQ